MSIPRFGLTVRVIAVSVSTAVLLSATACAGPRHVSGTGRMGGNGTLTTSPTASTAVDQPTGATTPAAGTTTGQPTSTPATTPATDPTTHGPTPLRVTLSAATPDHVSYTGLCVDHITFRVTISVNHGPTTVKYRWYASDGSRTSSDLQVAFPGTGAQVAHVSTTWDLGAPYTGWKELRTTAPTSVVSGRGNFASNCTRVQVLNPTSFPNPATGTCPVTVTFKATLRVYGPLTLTYRWVRSDGATGATSVINAPAGVNDYPIGTTWKIGGAGSTSYSGWQAVQFVSGATGTSAHINFTMTCTP